jgi:hypothetical protein
MKSLWCWATCFLPVLHGGCADYVRLADSSWQEISPPKVDYKHINPHPARMGAVDVGKNCRGQSFKVPPFNDKDRLYYLWFIDGVLAWPQSIIEPNLRNLGVIELTIDNELLQSLFGNKLPPDFFSRPHLVEFLVSDLPFKIPESRYINGEADNEKNHTDYAYWIVNFSNDPC